MSYTEIFGFKNGKVAVQEEIKNSFRGAMAVWTILDKTYLPPYYAKWDPTKPMSRASAMFDQDAMKEVWGLANDKKVPIDERLVMASTFDKVLVKHENLPKLIEAFRNFDEAYPEQSSIGEQADILQALYDDEEIDAVGWNQTSVNGDHWGNIGDYDEETEEYDSYDHINQTDHWWLFDDYMEEFFEMRDNL
jgi:hypothetical protein